MATSVRALLKFLIGLFAACSAAPTSAQAERPQGAARSGPSETAAFIAQLRQDAALRARFAQDPRAVLRARGVDLAPFELPERLDEAQLARLLGDWPRWRSGQRFAQASPPEPPQQPPAPVHGPPPRLNPRPPPSAVVVYGPPATPSRPPSADQPAPNTPPIIEQPGR